MLILGIDPGVTTGWALYDTEARRVVEAGTFLEHRVDNAKHSPLDYWTDDTDVVIERPVGQGPTRPTMVDCGITFGRLMEKFHQPHEITRLRVRQALTEAMHGTVRVVNDTTAKAALKALHGGEDSAKKGGPLYSLRGTQSHGWAALAVAVAWSLDHP